MVKHVLKDGTTVNDITGHIVKMKDAKAVYNLIESINQSKMRKAQRNEKSI